MNKTILLALLAISFSQSYAQRIVPANEQDSVTIILDGTIHVGNGQVIENGAVIFDKGKITFVGETSNVRLSGNAKIIRAQGKQIYPGIIAPNTDIGLSEIDAARATNDYNEVGNYNPGVRSLIAYNTDSKATPTVRSNGILIAQ